MFSGGNELGRGGLGQVRFDFFPLFLVGKEIIRFICNMDKLNTNWNLNLIGFYFILFISEGVPTNPLGRTNPFGPRGAG